MCCVAGQVWYLLYFTSYAMHMLVAVQRKTQILSELLEQFTNLFDLFEVNDFSMFYRMRIYEE